MFSKTCEHAIRAMIFIARRSKDGGRAGVREIAEAVGSPEAFIAKILQQLGRKGLVQSFKGPTGGFFLGQPTKNISLADIVRAIDGEQLFAGCGLGLPECSESHPCPLHDEFKRIRKDIGQLLERSYLDILQEPLEKNLSFLKH